jgi:enterochelin esterase family protein
MPGYAEPEHIAEPVGAARGRIEPMEFASEQLGDTRTLEVYLPAGYDEGDQTYPLLLVHQGPDWRTKGLLTNTLDNLIGERVRPLIAVFIPPTRAWWHEAGGTGTEEYIAMLATELVPALEATYRLSPEPADRAILGASSFGITAVYATFLQPDVFGLAAAQSLRLDDVARHELFRRIEEDERHDASFYLDWCRYEDRNQDAGYDLREHGQRTWKALAARGYPLTGGEANDAHGWGGWRARSDELLVALFPLKPGEPEESGEE